MTPVARISAAIEVLDRAVSGEPAERALTHWAGNSRFAGSKDRSAVRDHVYAALRCRRSFLALSGGRDLTGRALMIGALRQADIDPAKLFTGEGHAPRSLDLEESAALAGAPLPLTGNIALDCPDWLEMPLRATLGDGFAQALAIMRQRAPVFLRVNLARILRDGAGADLSALGIATRISPLARSALEVLENAPKIRTSPLYTDGLVELQDAAGQAVCEALPLRAKARVLDYCAGGGGKTLALAAREPGAQYFVHDALPQRMSDLAPRADRAGIRVTLLATQAVAAHAPFDLVVLDVPCSGSGTWARDPEGKWSLTPERLSGLCATQADILRTAAPYVARGGCLAYLTCSLLQCENGDQITGFLGQNAGFRLDRHRQLTPLEGADGFFMALLTRA